MQKKILITGASGFIGSTVVDKALELGYETWAGVRTSSSREYLTDPRIRFIDLTYSDKEKLTEQLRLFARDNGRFDAIVHIAGMTKALHKADFDRVNDGYTRHLADALIETGTVPDSFIFMSSLSAIGKGDEENYAPLRAEQEPNPTTAYGRSKLKAENYLKSLPGFPYVILRPTGVYGPRDKDYYILVKSVKNGLNVGAGMKRQLLTFIYSEDLARVIFLCIEKQVKRVEYIVADGDVYTDEEFNRIVQEVLHKKRVLRLKIPLGVVKGAAWVSEKVASLLGRASTFNTDKYNIMEQRNWNCDIEPIRTGLSFKPEYPLRRGVEETVRWYKEKGWL
ncbi:NAD-dependent epimerase/dehydratase family protein [Limibacterium fermenti]|uniref:NAD-dependent epimerase/dehydratase family protein n=1 Tax=Limibacterium fermenti TaxID=3229863 RepID=UPI000E9438CE|nr:NAD-dependent dehydratase [Porphyromonadaceae bacterium]